MSTWLITGASRGLGLEFVRQLSQNSSNIVFATCRDPPSASKLQALKESKSNVHVIPLDQENQETIKKAAVEVAGILEGLGKKDSLNYLLNNAAKQYAGDAKPSTIDPQKFLKTIENCVLGPVLVAQSFVPLMASAGRKVVMNMTSGLGSIGLDAGGSSTGYSVAKAALNMMTYKQSKEQTDIIWIAMDPGWVKTDMGGPNALLEQDFSISSMLKVLESVTEKDSGTFKRYDGTERPW